MGKFDEEMCGIDTWVAIRKIQVKFQVKNPSISQELKKL
jgi:hypothetical protein